MSGNGRNTPLAIASRKLANQAMGLCKCCGLRPRLGLGGLCDRCADRKGLYGDPKGRRLYPWMWTKEYSQVRFFLKRFTKEQHPAILGSLEFFTRWLDDAANGRDCPGAKAMGMLYDRGGDPALMLQAVLTVALYSRRVDSEASRAPFILCNAMLSKGYKGQPRGWVKKGYVSPQFPQLTLGYRARKAISDHIRGNLRNVFISMFEFMDRKEALFNERALALQGKFPVKRTRSGQLDKRSQLSRSQEGSSFPKGTTNTEGRNQYNREIDPIPLKPPKPPGKNGPIPYHQGGHKGNQNSRIKGKKNE